MEALRFAVCPAVVETPEGSARLFRFDYIFLGDSTEIPPRTVAILSLSLAQLGDLVERAEGNLKRYATQGAILMDARKGALEGKNLVVNRR